jgi:hypothetical protein
MNWIGASMGNPFRSPRFRARASANPSRSGPAPVSPWNESSKKEGR